MAFFHLTFHSFLFLLTPLLTFHSCLFLIFLVSPFFFFGTFFCLSFFLFTPIAPSERISSSSPPPPPHFSPNEPFSFSISQHSLPLSGLHFLPLSLFSHFAIISSPSSFVIIVIHSSFHYFYFLPLHSFPPSLSLHPPVLLFLLFFLLRNVYISFIFCFCFIKLGVFFWGGVSCFIYGSSLIPLSASPRFVFFISHFLKLFLFFFTFLFTLEFQFFRFILLSTLIYIFPSLFVLFFHIFFLLSFFSSSSCISHIHFFFRLIVNDFLFLNK